MVVVRTLYTPSRSLHSGIGHWLYKRIEIKNFPGIGGGGRSVDDGLRGGTNGGQRAVDVSLIDKRRGREGEGRRGEGIQ